MDKNMFFLFVVDNLDAFEQLKVFFKICHYPVEPYQSQGDPQDPPLQFVLIKKIIRKHFVPILIGLQFLGLEILCAKFQGIWNNMTPAWAIKSANTPFFYYYETEIMSDIVFYCPFSNSHKSNSFQDFWLNLFQASQKLAKLQTP